MNDTLSCPTVQDADTVHRYVAGTLGPHEVEAFEIHLLECASCQEVVREGVAIRQALSRGGPTSLRPRFLLWAGPIAAAAALAVWLVLRPVDPLARLARVDVVPGFEGLAVRAEADSAATMADRGMAAYLAGDFREAARLLGGASELDPAPAVHFFLGIARLKIGASEEAIAALSLAAEPPDNPYAAEAHLYLSKAWLGLGNADSALVHLGRVSAGVADVRAHAVALADSVREAMR